jgi:hypothetical protein
VADFPVTSSQAPPEIHWRGGKVTLTFDQTVEIHRLLLQGLREDEVMEHLRQRFDALRAVVADALRPAGDGDPYAVPSAIEYPNAERRQHMAALLRGLAEQIEHPYAGSPPVMAMHWIAARHYADTAYIDTPHEPLTPELGRQVEILIGWGTPKRDWRWGL